MAERIRAHFITEVTVEGRGPFPFDMLRYDQCAPYSSEDARRMEPDCDGERRIVRLNAYNSKLTPERWRSFGWIMKEVM